MPSRTSHGLFEALFDRRLKPSGAFEARLREAGYAPATAQGDYPTAVWVACLEVARDERYRELPVGQAYRALGREFTLGFLETLMGRLIAAALPWLTPESFLRRLGRYFTMGRSGETISYELAMLGPGSAQLTIDNPALVPGEFVAGLIEVAMEHMRQRVTVVVDQRSPRAYLVSVDWAAS